ncbi:DUF177 domain-containing protein [Tenacibaculum sp. UWU-22]|uniref:YceD family protein n=1 Tax=Tenacibaculum sp. UWU-22 TaxID=3234187 RepID=UPI0034DABC88
MKDLKQFNIPFVGLKEKDYTFQYQIDLTFFKAFDYTEFENSDVNVTLTLTKKSTLMELYFVADGTVTLPCDLTNELYDQKIEATLSLVVKFGPEFNDDNEEILILPYDAYQINVAQYIYEMIVLAVPAKRISPKIAEGKTDSVALEKLKELEVNNKKKGAKQPDPRWDKLKDLLTDKKT